jgi:PIN domain-containing addiction module
MIKYLLDTNICIYLIRKNPPTIVQRFQALRKGEVAISAITWAELCCGIRKDGAGAVEALLSQLEVLPFDTDAGRVYGELTTRFPQRKASLDRMIAAHAIASGSTLVTNNLADFLLYQPAGLKVDNWVDDSAGAITAPHQ